MTESSSRLPDTDRSEEPAPSQSDPSLETLRGILFDRYRRQIAELEAELDDLERRITDKDTLATIVAPIISDAIRRKIRDARDEMVEALYPIIGQTVVRAVSEAIRDLARNVDAQMRTSLSPQAIWRRARGRARGISDGEMALREALPFEVTETFLIHRETGLLLRHVSRDSSVSSDSDLVSGMLTAIRDFVQDAFGHGKEGQLDEIQYGEQRILIEAAQYAYLAVVVDGIEPPGFRAEMRERVIEISNTYEEILRNYQGDSSPLAPVQETLQEIAAAEPRELSPVQKRVLVLAFGLAVVCLVTVCLGGGWAWRVVRSTPTPLPATMEPTSTSTITPSPTPTATPSPTPTPSATPTPTSTPTPTATPTSFPTPTPLPTATPAPMIGVMVGNTWVREAPSNTASRVGLILEQGQPVEILALFDDWYRVRWISRDQDEVTGWVSARWVGTVNPIPTSIITPTVGP
jgi:hypothetical protein